MPDLIAQGPQPHHRWRRRLPEELSLVIGRTSAEWATPWDDHISRQHASVIWNANRLEVRRLPEARNPLFFRGQPVDFCSIRPGDHFVIGRTTFTMVDEQVNVSQDGPTPENQQTFRAQELRQVEFRNADQRIAVLSRLPEVIAGAGNDNELVVRLVNLLLAGIPRADAVAIVATQNVDLSHDDSELTAEILHWDRRLMAGTSFAPSGRLIRQAVRRGESVLHWWRGTTSAMGPFTLSTDADWAFCTPVPGQACRGWAIYVAGRFSASSSEQTNHGMATSTDVGNGEEDLRDEVKFTELAATTLSNLRATQQLVRRQTSLSQFFSPVVLDAISRSDPDEVLSPREADVSVLFCDLRGFSRTSERSSGDLLGLLHRVSRALGVMTHHILEQGGVVGDFHGDAAMGFWGWPLPQADAAERACRAAIRIRAEFAAAAQEPDHPLTDFRIGIGVASGRAVAGKIGSVDQVKVTVFGPVVNLASRLEEMTKLLRAPILLDEQTARRAREKLTTDVARVRRVAVVRPYGFTSSMEVSELLPPVTSYPQLSDDHIAAYESAVQALYQRDWQRAFQLLHLVPAEDRVKDFLTVFIAQHNRTPPENWDGVIPLMTK